MAPQALTGTPLRKMQRYEPAGTNPNVTLQKLFAPNSLINQLPEQDWRQSFNVARVQNVELYARVKSNSMNG